MSFSLSAFSQLKYTAGCQGKICYCLSMAEQNRTEQNHAGLDWEDIRVFLALARYGSLSAAARTLSVNHATIARRIQSFQATIGERLVERRPDGYVLTPAGTRVLASANDMEAAAAVLFRGGADDRPKGLVRINAPPSLAQYFLVPKLAALAVQHGGLDIDVSTEFRAISLERREADIALRLGRPDDGDIIAKPLVKLGFGLYATVALRDQIRSGARPVFVGFGEAQAHLPEVLWLSRSFPRARMAFRANGQVAQAAAAKAGAGVALLPHFIGQNENGLVPCRLDHAPPTREIWLITRRHDRNDLLIRTVVQFLQRTFEEERGQFEPEADEVSEFSIEAKDVEASRDGSSPSD
jgi:DNA-binding transcriptional LysR family regulator